MHALNKQVHKADVVAAFSSQTDIEAAILQLRQAGFRNKHIGYFVWHPMGGLRNLRDHTAGREGAVAGGVVGALFGLWVMPVLNRFVSPSGVHTFVELVFFSMVCASVVFGFVGWKLGARVHDSYAEAPAIDPAEGAFILTVDAGEAKEWVWSVIRQNGGHEPHHAMAPYPGAI
jgi:hypothetical protein